MGGLCKSRRKEAVRTMGHTRARHVKDAPPSAILRATSHAPEDIPARVRDQPIWSRWRAESTAEGGGVSSPPAATRYRDSCVASAFQLGNSVHARFAKSPMSSPARISIFANEPAPTSTRRTKEVIWGEVGGRGARGVDVSSKGQRGGYPTAIRRLPGLRRCGGAFDRPNVGSYWDAAHARCAIPATIRCYCRRRHVPVRA